MLKNILIVILMYMIMYAFGYPIERLLFPKHFKKYALAITPWIGLSIGMIVFYYLSLLGFSVERSASGVVILFLCIDFFLVIINNDHGYKRKDLVILCVVFVTGSLILSLAACIYNNNFPIIFENNDYVLYTLIANSLKKMSIKELASNNMLFGMTDLWITGTQNRLICLLMAFYSQLLNLDIFSSAYYFSICLFALSVMTFYKFVEMFLEQINYLVIALIFFCFNCNYMYIFFQGFIGQITSVGLMIGFTIVITELYQQFSPRGAIVFGILVVGLCMTYGEMIPVAVVPLLLLLVSDLVMRRKQAIIMLKNYSIALIVVFILFARAYISVINMMIVSNEARVGWDIAEGYLLQGLGIYNVFKTNLFGTTKWPIGILLFVSVLIISFMFRYIYLHRMDEKFHIIYIYFISYIVVYSAFVIRYDSYKSYKVLVNISYIFIMLFICMLAQEKLLLSRNMFNIIRQGIISLSTILIVSSGVVMLCWSLAIGKGIAKDQYMLAKIIGRGHQELQKVIEENEDCTFYVSGNDYWNLLAATTMLVKNDMHIMDNKSTSWLNNDVVNPLPFPYNDKAIYIDSTIMKEPFDIEGRVLLSNEFYTIKLMDRNFPVCINRTEFGENTILQIADGKMTTGRKVINKVSEVVFCAADNSIHDVYLRMKNVSANSNQVIITIPGGGEFIMEFLPGEEKDFVIPNVDFMTGNNIFKVTVKDENIYFLNFSFEEDECSKVAVSQLGDNIGSYSWLTVEGLKDYWDKIFGVKPMNQNEMVFELSLHNGKAILSEESNVVNGTIRVKNASQKLLLSTGGNTPINIGAQLCNENNELINADMSRIVLDKRMWFNNETINIDFSFPVNIADIREGYKIRFLPIQEGVSWFPLEKEGNFVYMDLELSK